MRASDVATTPVRLKIIGEVAAGRPFGRTVGPGEAARIFTGGVMPDGTDAIIIQEHTKRDGDVVEVAKPSAKGRHIRTKGLDFTPARPSLPRAIGLPPATSRSPPA